ncbi:hypothetical protein [Mesorhizobium sp. LjNodule214]|uniref:hypothetical protein n=1 Tax=Mesorhizobium sp. LjNodule214 TaxID=3342252 RepID=UPI003ED0BFB9
MAEDRRKGDLSDRKWLFADDDYEVKFFAMQNNMTPEQVRELIRRHGNSRTILTKARAGFAGMTKLSDLGPPIVGTRQGEPVNEGEHFHRCPACAQAVDWRDLRQVIWHEQPGHAPLNLDS